MPVTVGGSLEKSDRNNDDLARDTLTAEDQTAEIVGGSKIKNSSMGAN